MTRINRRRFTQLSGAGALAAGTGGLAGILASGRAPAYGQTAAVHWLRWADFVPASDVLLKGEIVAAMPEGSRHQAHRRDDQRQRHPGARHLVDSIRHRPRHHHGDSTTGRSSTPRALPTSATSPSNSARRGRLLRYLQGGRHLRQQLDRRALVHRRRARRLSQVLAGRGRCREIPDELGRLPRRRQEAEGGGPSLWPDRRTHLRRRAGLVVSLSVVVGRQGGRGRRQDRRAEHQGDGRVGQVRRRPVEGDDGRRRSLLGRHQQQPRLPVGQHQRHQQRCLDLSRSQEEARQLSDREGHADEGRHPSRQHPGRRRRSVQPAWAQ